MKPILTALDHLVLTVCDLDESIEFYAGVLGLEAEQFIVADGTQRWAIRFGQQKINLHEAGAEFEPRADEPTPGSADLCFLSETKLADWVLHLHGQNIEIEEGPVTRTGAQGILNSIYLRDPDGNLVEIANQN